MFNNYFHGDKNKIKIGQNSNESKNILMDIIVGIIITVVGGIILTLITGK